MSAVPRLANLSAEVAEGQLHQLVDEKRLSQDFLQFAPVHPTLIVSGGPGGCLGNLTVTYNGRRFLAEQVADYSSYKTKVDLKFDSKEGVALFLKSYLTPRKWIALWTGEPIKSQVLMNTVIGQLDDPMASLTREAVAQNREEIERAVESTLTVMMSTIVTGYEKTETPQKIDLRPYIVANDQGLRLPVPELNEEGPNSDDE